MKLPLFLMAVAFATAFAIATAKVANAQAPADIVLIENASAKVTRADFESEIAKLPPDSRPGFATSTRRVNDLLTRLLVQKSLAAQARTAKLDATPENALRVQLEIERLLAQIMIAEIEAEAGAAFDAKRSQYEKVARERYLVDRSKYETPEQLQATHILFDTKKRNSDAARRLAEETRGRIVAGANMGELALKLSDDPSARSNNGRLDWFARKEMDAAFAESAFALKNIGDLSEPVQSQFGWHVIRLEARRPAGVKTFDQVREQIVAELRQTYINEQREAKVAAIRNDPTNKANREAIEALTPRVDQDAVRRAVEDANAGRIGPTVPASAPAAK